MFPVVVEVPSLTTADDAEPFAMGAASAWCDYCSIETVPVPLSNPLQGWNLFPCHLTECSCCYTLDYNVCDNCEQVPGCCSCYYCEWGEHMVSDVCGNCDYCSDHCNCEDEDEDDCDCSSCRGVYFGSAPWVRRNDPMPTATTVDVARMIREESQTMGLDPVQSMADFYLCDYVATVIKQGFRYGTGMNNGTRNAHQLRTSAENFQRHIVRRADSLFQDYVFAAIGGEVRHHGAVRGSVPGGRESCWDYWFAMGDTIGREVLTQDCVDIFGDGSWDSGYGGWAWEQIARVLLARLDGSLDARTFVDRVFSLQHNGGSLLDKARWASLTDNSWGVGYCQNIGNAHASHRIAFDVLLENASEEVRRMVWDLLITCPRHVPGYGDDSYASDYFRIREAFTSLPNMIEED